VSGTTAESIVDARLLNRLVQLTDESLQALAKRSERLSDVIQKAIRIARLRNDWEALWWLEMEMLPSHAREEAKRRLAAEILPHLKKGEAEKMVERVLNLFIEERTVTALQDIGSLKKGKQGVLTESVSEIEGFIEHLHRAAGQLTVPAGLHPVDTYHLNEKLTTEKLTLGLTIRQREAVLDTIRHRVHEYLSVTEKQLLFGSVNADIFERNRRYVDARLAKVAPEVGEQFASAYKRLSSDEGSEAFSHALTSCRRALKSLADRVYPARDPIQTSDGKLRDLSDDKFVNRLWQYISENIGSKTARSVTLAQLEDLGKRLDTLHDMTCKGVHADISQFDANQCVIQTYLLIGDILRLSEGDSGADVATDIDARALGA
jgi:hypothetical protein